MIELDIRSIKALRDRVNRELTYIPTFKRFDLKEEQEAYFHEERIDDGKKLHELTVKARKARKGYYKRRRAPGVGASAPYMKWTGNTLKHTYRERGRVTVRQFVMSFHFKLLRKMKQPWDVKQAERKFTRESEKRLERELNRPT